MGAAVVSFLREVVKPTTRADLDRVTDVYVIEHEGHNPHGAFRPGGEGAFGYYGEHRTARFEGTELAGFAEELYRAALAQRGNRSNFRVTHEGVHYRCQRGLCQSGWQLAFRRNPTTTPTIDDLSIEPKPLVDVLLAEWLNNGGLVLFAALTGQGKSTLAAALLKSRMLKFGGRVVTAEEPPELPLEGFHGDATCNQFEVTWDDPDPMKRGFAGAVRDSLRRMPATRPATLFIGEIRDTETAVEAIKAALSGLIVVATIHAEATNTALERLLSLASDGLGNAAGGMLGAALRAVIHQELVLDPSKSGWKRGTYRLDGLICPVQNHPLANALRDRSMQHVPGVQEEQKTAIRLAHENEWEPELLLRRLTPHASRY